MKQEVRIQEVRLCCGYEGKVIIEFDGLKVLAYYQDTDEYIKAFVIGPEYKPSRNYSRYTWNSKSGYMQKTVLVDLKLIYSKLKKLNGEIFSKRKDIISANIKGKVIQILPSQIYRIDCGVTTIDVENEELVDEIEIGNFVQTDGMFFVSFSESD